MRLLLRHQALLVLATGFVLLTNLGSTALFNDNEAKSVATAAEMSRQGAWIVPTFNGGLNWDWPILADWSMLASFRVLGVSEFSARLIPAFFAIGTTLLTYHMGRKLYSADIGFLAGIVLCTCLLFAALGRIATPDSAHAFFVTLAFASYVWIVARQRGVNFCRSRGPKSSLPTSKPSSVPSTIESTEQPESLRPTLLTRITSSPWLQPLAVFGPLGIAVLALGPVAVVLPCGTLVLFLLISRRYDDLESGTIEAPSGPKWRNVVVMIGQLLRPKNLIAVIREIHLPIGLCIVAAIAAPWFLVVGSMTNGEWLRGYLFDHMISSFVSPKSTVIAFYQILRLALFLIGCFPWVAFLPVAIYRLSERLTFGAPWRESDQLLACWIGVWFVVCTLLSADLPASLLPMLPPVALTLARYFIDWSREKVNSSVYSFSLCCRAMWIVGIAYALGISLVAYVYFPAAQWIGLLGFVPVIGGIVAAKFLDNERRQDVIRTLIGTGLVFAFLMIAIAPSSIRQYQDSAIFVAEARQFAKSSDVVIGTYAYFEPSLVYYSGKNVAILKTPRQVAEFVTSHPHAYVIAPATKFVLNDLREALVGGGNELSRHKNFFHGRELALIGRN